MGAGTKLLMGWWMLVLGLAVGAAFWNWLLTAAWWAGTAAVGLISTGLAMRRQRRAAQGSVRGTGRAEPPSWLPDARR